MTVTSVGRPYTLALLNGGRSADPRQFSGIPHSLATSFEALGVRVVPLEPGFPARVQQVVDGRIQVRTLAIDATSAVLTRKLRRRDDVDGVLVIGSGEQYVRTALPLVTYDDLTVAQAQRVGHDAPQALGPRLTAHWRRRQARVLRAATVCGTFTSWVADSIVDDYAIDPAAVRVLGWGRNHEPDDHGERDWETPAFLFVGVDWKRKNGEAVVRAFKALRAEWPAARLDVVGGHPRIDEDGVTGHGMLRLDRPDERSRLRGLFATATCFVMPSWNEPSGIVYAEAAAAGLSLIGTKEGGSAELIAPGCGFVVDPGDGEELLAAMRTLAEPAAAAAAGEMAHTRSRLFTWPLVCERILRALDAPEWQGRPWSPFLREDQLSHG